jgi:hypothetical protein
MNPNATGTARARKSEPTNALQGWKEIATYVKRSIRTVQRWERSAGLPIRRPRPGERGPVIAFPEEIDNWLHSLPTRDLAASSPVAGQKPASQVTP